jgi:hypothetical protein
MGKWVALIKINFKGITKLIRPPIHTEGLGDITGVVALRISW